jgi:hypothetical protein
MDGEYYTPYGYKGYIAGIGYMEFATEEEYYEYQQEHGGKNGL